jgi:hypothetical protein
VVLQAKVLAVRALAFTGQQGGKARPCGDSE